MGQGHFSAPNWLRTHERRRRPVERRRHRLRLRNGYLTSTVNVTVLRNGGWSTVKLTMRVWNCAVHPVMLHPEGGVTYRTETSFVWSPAGIVIELVWV